MADVKAAVKKSDPDRGRITDEGIEDLRSRIGRPIPVQEFGPPIPVVGVDSARLWAWGIGDDNPLYNSVEYGASSAWGTMLASPSIVIGMDPHRLGIMGGLPGVHALYAGINFEWFAPIPLGTAIETKGAVVAVDERETRISGRSVKVTTKVDIGAVGGGPLATMEHIATRHERAETRSRKSFDGDAARIPHVYTDDEIAAISAEYRREGDARRGDEPRLWDTVTVGDPIGPILKGPLTVTGIVAFAMAVRPVHLTKAHRLASLFYDRHPGAAIPNEQNVPEAPISVHWSESQARNSGLPTAYDFGMERACWASHLFTDWMGDNGFLRSLSVSFKGINYIGDLTRFTGRVEEKAVEGDLHVVRCSFEGTNQRGQVTTAGSATVALPTSASGVAIG